MDEKKIMRLQKFIALSGLTSRRKAEQMIVDGLVQVNGKVVKELGQKINIDRDIVHVNGKLVQLEDKKTYIMLNKPTGYVTTVSDQFNRPTVIDLIKDDISQRLYPVGRLDYDTEGLLLLTNDGDLTYKLTHPKHNIDKVYYAVIKGIPNDKKLLQFRQGLAIEDYITSPASIKITKRMGKNCEVKIIIHEGKNRQVRKMCEAIGHPVIHLKRTAIGKLTLGGLDQGKWRYLTRKELEYLKSI